MRRHVYGDICAEDDPAAALRIRCNPNDGDCIWGVALPSSSDALAIDRWCNCASPCLMHVRRRVRVQMVAGQSGTLLTLTYRLTLIHWVLPDTLHRIGHLILRHESTQAMCQTCARTPLGTPLCLVAVRTQQKPFTDTHARAISHTDTHRRVCKLRLPAIRRVWSTPSQPKDCG